MTYRGTYFSEIPLHMKFETTPNGSIDYFPIMEAGDGLKSLFSRFFSYID